ncbi:hypothetical protein TorRG33x02_175040 [Trema orientale]|uniref:Uncharacterized protein n=1 Tax=Trema orientale TaxID=63057 RepID=A0A2P5EMF3_TREOI|nr:hypothetical protein TorRG33x02_175040 [Trema orientale]
MSSSLRLNMASDEWAPFQPETTTTTTKPELGTSSGAKTRGRKTSNKGGTGAPNNPKKQPQRGLGVAQLERLRLQERWKKMTEMPHQLHSPPPPPPQALNFPAAAPADYHHHLLMSHYYFQNPAHHHHHEPLESVPVQYGAGSYGVAVNGSVAVAQCHGGTDRCLGMVHHHHQRMGHVATSGFGCGSSSSSFPSSPAAGVMDHRSVTVDPHHHQYCYGRGNGIDINGAPSPDQMFLHHETSKELSSMPKMQPCFVTSDLCSKKKRFNGGNIGGVRGDIKCPEILQFCGLNGSNSEYHVPNSTGSDQLTLGLGTTAARSIMTNEGVEVVAVHRKGNSVSGGVVLMEYEFFPGKNDSCSSTGSKKASVSVMPGGEASYYDMISNPVDLSLTL